VLHSKLREVTKDLVGIDYDKLTIEELKTIGYSEIIYGDVESLDVITIPKTFDIIVCGDLIEHLSQPGKMLEGVKPFMNQSTEIIITTPNAFGILNFIRNIFNRYKEGNDHVLSFNIYTLRNLLKRHGFIIKDTFTCYNKPPNKKLERLIFAVGSQLFNIFPKYGGTLLVTAKLK
jgi:2-polyprenyl-3-methyl-5-hydroxy-6-metoxy-1,4-benzoquinol methylase